MRIGNTLYFDHQATTPADIRVLEAMIPYFRGDFGNPHSSDHSLGWRAAAAVDGAAAYVADLLGADTDEIIFTSGATEANNLALLGLGRQAAYGKRNRILVGATEHKCVIETSRQLKEKHGYKVEYIPVDNFGFLDLNWLDDHMTSDVLVTSVMSVNNEIGTIQDFTSISNIARRHGSLLHCDAAQAPLAQDLSSYAHLADLISLSAHKMYGPKGIGALFVSRPVQEAVEPVIYGGGQQNKLRPGTVPTPLAVGMGEAARLFTVDEAAPVRSTLAELRDLFVKSLGALPWQASLNGPSGEKRHPANANIRFDGFAADDILRLLQPRLAASTGSACTSGIPEPSHVLRSIGLTMRAS